MKILNLKVLKNFFFLTFLILSFTSCSYHKNVFTGTNNFQSLMTTAIKQSIEKIKKKIGTQEVILVSDFVNIYNLENKTQLGFLLSSLLKDELSKNDIIIREIEFAKEFQLGSKGFNVLVRDRSRILSNEVNEERFALVGTYSLTTKSLNVFIKLIDMQTGHILASSYERTSIDKEIKELEGDSQRRARAPRVVL